MKKITLIVSLVTYCFATSVMSQSNCFFKALADNNGAAVFGKKSDAEKYMLQCHLKEPFSVIKMPIGSGKDVSYMYLVGLVNQDGKMVNLAWPK